MCSPKLASFLGTQLDDIFLPSLQLSVVIELSLPFYAEVWYLGLYDPELDL